MKEIEVVVNGQSCKVAEGSRPLDLPGKPEGTLACAVNGATIDLKRPLWEGGHNRRCNHVRVQRSTKYRLTLRAMGMACSTPSLRVST